VNDVRNVPSNSTVNLVNRPDRIADIFKLGLQTNRGKNPNLSDADMFSAMLISLAWQQFADEPDAAPQIFTVLDSYAVKFPARERYMLLDTFLENLETALLKSRDAEHLKTNWSIRQKAIEKQKAALNIWTSNTIKELDEFKQTVEKISLSDILPLDSSTQESIEFLLGDEIALEFDRKTLEEKVENIAEIIDRKLADMVKKFEAGIETERQIDLTGSVGPVLDKANSKDNLKVWEKGKYQELLNDALPLIQLRDNTAVSFWTAYLPVDREDNSFVERIGKAYQEAQRLQRLRYNLWAVRTLSADSDVSQLSHIDTGVLEPSVNALYSQQESELISKRPNERSRSVREILLRDKIPLLAF
jgi:hypothetical protein